ncbi:MAG: hypothetical protein WC494_02415 [Candidatus Pacearchaeota archaeon]
MNKKAQQEMVGFVLIVVVVVVGLMIYLVISLKSEGGERTSVQADNILDSIMKMTTECAPVFEPDYDDYEELFGSCYANEVCSNLNNKKACDYLNESLSDVLEGIIKSEAEINYYKFELFVKDGAGLLEIKQGNCTGSITGAQRQTSKNSQVITTRITICS